MRQIQTLVKYSLEDNFDEKFGLNGNNFLLLFDD